MLPPGGLQKPIRLRQRRPTDTSSREIPCTCEVARIIWLQDYTTNKLLGSTASVLPVFGSVSGLGYIHLVILLLPIFFPGTSTAYLHVLYGPVTSRPFDQSLLTGTPFITISDSRPIMLFRLHLMKLFLPGLPLFSPPSRNPFRSPLSISAALLAVRLCFF